MRFFALHDSEGNISRVVGCPSEAPPMLPRVLEPGQIVTEITLPEGMIAGSADPETLKSLLDVVKNFRVDTPAIRPVQIGRKDQAQYG